jgi:hypothetical protein
MNLEQMTVAIIGIDYPSPNIQCVGGMVLRNCDKKTLSTTRLCQRPDPVIKPDVTILATVHDALAWEHILEPPLDNRISPMTDISPAEARGLKAVLSAGDVRADRRKDL